jgi:hypothetical protein
MALENYTDAELLAYLDESLAVERMAAIEQALRGSDELRKRTAGLLRRRDQGAHSVGESWRRWRLSCPTRHQLGSYLLGAVDAGWADYLNFHLQTVGCRFCAANLEDLRQALAATPEVQRRRQKFFESSAGRVRDWQRKP